MKLKDREITLHKNFYRIMRPPVGSIITRFYNYSYEPVKNIDVPQIVVANHNCDLDPVLLGLAFPHLYFVASEHIFRNSFLSALLSFFLSPIVRKKGSIDASTVIDMRNRLKAGCSIAIFPEGTKSMSGCTEEVHPTTGKLIKACGAALVTYRIEGGYLSTPRWSFSRRRGKMKGICAGVYMPEDLKKMTPAEVSDLINRDIFVNAYEMQKQQMIRYHGGKLAKGMETALYMCPKCKQIGTLYTTDCEIKCECGLQARYNEFGYFEGEHLPFDNFTDWYQWQTKEFSSDLEKYVAEIKPRNNLVTLNSVGNKHKRKKIIKGDIIITSDKVTITNAKGVKEEFLLSDISSINMCGRNRLMFTAKQNYYEIVPQKLFNARLILHLYDNMNK